MKNLYILFLRLLGWKFIGGIPDGIKKCVLIGAYHTSSWDFLYGRLGMGALGVKIRYLIKKEFFFFPLKYFFRATGGIPVDRSKRNSLVEQMVSFINKQDEIALTISPEGTRSKNEDWKRGFYYIALGANIPIVMGYLDYKKKVCYIGGVLQPSGDYRADLLKIKAFYKDVIPKHPELGAGPAIPS